jgi:hypothetical protein
LEFDIGLLPGVNFLIRRQSGRRQDDGRTHSIPVVMVATVHPHLLRHGPAAENELVMAFGMPETKLSRDRGAWKCRK